ncbi:MAG TPA: PIG-L family deacetylase, partial [Massilia timonae]|nr:PIG-L family deacetylase [Massilia timonae]
MPIEPVALFLFAHQDDEFGVFERIATLRRQGVRVACAYLTDG